MITEDYVSFEIAKLLKEKGFDEPCGSYWEYFRSDVTLYQGYVPEYSNSLTNHNKDKGDSNVFSRPTHQMALKWLREEKNIWCEITWEGGKNSWCFEAFNLKNEEYISDSIHHKINSYEEAVEVALKYTLENLM